MTLPGKIRTCTTSAAAFALLAGAAFGQYAERPNLVNTENSDIDASGRSVKNPRVRAVHSDNNADVGATAYFIDKDPYLAYQLGRNLNFREFRTRDGVFRADSTAVGGFGGPMVDGNTAKITANNHTSCSGCHNLPQGNPGGGTNFSKDSGLGRNAPHYYGSGIMEMLAIQIRADMLSQIDANDDGWVSASEAAAAPTELMVTPSLEGDPINYGNPQLDGGATGAPAFNSIFRVWYGLDDGEGNIEIVPGATGIDGVTTTHYNFNMIVWGWGQNAPPAALNPTNRVFLWDPYVTHSGLDSHDPSTLNDPDGDGISEPTLSGAIQFPATHKAPDGGTTLDVLGFSLDDPDGDGYLTEISEGDLDLAEWFMLNAPRPAFAGDEKEFKRGIKQMDKLGCTTCHVAEWTIAAADDTFAGDRRFFDLDVTYNKYTKKEKKELGAAGRLEASLVELFTPNGDVYERNFGSFTETALFTDFRQHDVGEDFYELGFDGNVQELWRTPPLWGVGSGFPWGHDGASLTLEDVILRHGGEAQESRDKFAKLGAGRRRAITEFLGKLVLFDIESMPTDMDGDGEISDAFMVGGVDTGVERFNAEWLFETPVIIQGDVTNTQGDTVTSFAATNLADAYGLNLEFRVDTDLDGWPDVWDNDPATPGFKDGVNN